MATAVQKISIGPEHHGRRMAFEKFIRADFQDGWLYELARGIIVVTDIPGIHQGWIVERLSDLFTAYKFGNPGIITYRAGGAESRLRLPGMRCDRHPDQAVYLDPPPEGDQPWTEWVPHVVEVVSKGGVNRDYVEKKEEYLRIGVKEYWILDPIKNRMTILNRAGDTWTEKVLTGRQLYRTELLPGLEVRAAELLGPARL